MSWLRAPTEPRRTLSEAPGAPTRRFRQSGPGRYAPADATPRLS